MSGDFHAFMEAIGHLFLLIRLARGSRDHGSVLKTLLLQFRFDFLVCAVNTHLSAVLERQLCP